MTSATSPVPGPPLPASVRRSYGLGSVATGSFGTVPGLLLLPYLTDRIGVPAAAAGVIVFAPKARDVVLNPVAGRVSDRSTHPDGRRRPFLLRGVPRLCDGLQLLPGALRRDAGRDHRRLRRTHAAHDVAGRDPRARDPRQRWRLAGHP